MSEPTIDLHSWLLPGQQERLTLDTSVLVGYWKNETGRRAPVDELLRRQREGSVHLAVTARAREDVPNDPLASELNRLPELEIAETGSVTRLGLWVLGRDHLGSQAFEDAIEQLGDWRPSRGKQPDFRDHDHLHAHYLLRRDVFLTWDEPLIELAARLAESFPIRAVTPEQYLAARAPGTASPG